VLAPLSVVLAPLSVVLAPLSVVLAPLSVVLAPRVSGLGCVAGRVQRVIERMPQTGHTS